MSSIHGKYLEEHFRTNDFGFCNTAVHSCPLTWEIVTSTFITTRFGYKHLPQRYWIFNGDTQVSASHGDADFLRNVIEVARDLYLLSI